MALAVVAVVPTTLMAGTYYWIVIHDGSLLLAVPVILIAPFVLRSLIRGWLRRPPTGRRTAPELSGPSPSGPA